MWALHGQGAGGIIGDEMGLGKASERAREKERKPSQRASERERKRKNVSASK
jgi:hypothetical protein